MRRVRPRIALATLLPALLLAAAPALAQDEDSTKPAAEQTVARAHAVLDEFLRVPEMTWLRDHLADAEGVLIVPSLVKMGLLLGGTQGWGVLMRHDKTTGRWSGPAFYQMGSLSVGLQAGIENTRIVMLVGTPKGMDSLAKTSVKLGATASIAAGPVGGGATAATSPMLSSDFITFSRGKGVYGGIALESLIVEIDAASNRAYYGSELTPAQIFANPGTQPGAAALRALLDAERRG